MGEGGNGFVSCFLIFWDSTLYSFEAGGIVFDLVGFKFLGDEIIF